MARVFITGGHGFIGRHLGRRLAAEGHVVAGLGHGVWPAVEAAEWGISDWLNGALDGANLRVLQQRFGTPERIFHLAGGSSVGVAIANPREDFLRTVASTAELLEWMRTEATDAALVAISSAAVYGSGRTGRLAEDLPLAPFSPYGHHKAMMESLCRSYCDSFGLKVAIARLFSVFGPELRKQLLWDLCSRLAAGERRLMLGGSGGELRDWTEVRDVASALARIVECASAAMPVVNLGTGTGTPVRDVAAAVTAAWNPQTPAEIVFSGVSRPGDPFSLIADPTRLEALGCRFETGFATGIRDYVTWFRERR